MKLLALIILFVFSIGCDANRDASLSDSSSVGVAAVASTETASETDSFRIRNKEIRDEMIELFEKSNIQHTLNDDNSITYFLVDGDQIDDIYTEVRLAYIRAN